jgi:hypothetical protein
VNDNDPLPLDLPEARPQIRVPSRYVLHRSHREQSNPALDTSNEDAEGCPMVSRRSSAAQRYLEGVDGMPKPLESWEFVACQGKRILLISRPPALMNSDNLTSPSFLQQYPLLDHDIMKTPNRRSLRAPNNPSQYDSKDEEYELTFNRPSFPPLFLNPLSPAAVPRHHDVPQVPIAHFASFRSCCSCCPSFRLAI